MVPVVKGLRKKKREEIKASDQKEAELMNKYDNKIEEKERKESERKQEEMERKVGEFMGREKKIWDAHKEGKDYEKEKKRLDRNIESAVKSLLIDDGIYNSILDGQNDVRDKAADLLNKYENLDREQTDFKNGVVESFLGDFEFKDIHGVLKFVDTGLAQKYRENNDAISKKVSQVYNPPAGYYDVEHAIETEIIEKIKSKLEDQIERAGRRGRDTQYNSPESQKEHLEEMAKLYEAANYLQRSWNTEEIGWIKNPTSLEGVRVLGGDKGYKQDSMRNIFGRYYPDNFMSANDYRGPNSQEQVAIAEAYIDALIAREEGGEESLQEIEEKIQQEWGGENLTETSLYMSKIAKVRTDFNNFIDELKGDETPEDQSTEYKVVNSPLFLKLKKAGYEDKDIEDFAEKRGLDVNKFTFSRK